MHYWMHKANTVIDKLKTLARNPSKASHAPSREDEKEEERKESQQNAKV